MVCIAFNKTFRVILRQYRSAVLSFVMLTCSPVCAPRTLVFRPLVKGNEALGTRLEFAILYYNSTRVLDLSIKLLALGASRFCSEKGKKLLRNMPESCSKVAKI